MNACAWWRGGHLWKWDDPKYEKSNGYVQTGHCERCNKARAREVAL